MFATTLKWKGLKSIGVQSKRSISPSEYVRQPTPLPAPLVLAPVTLKILDIIFPINILPKLTALDKKAICDT